MPISLIYKGEELSGEFSNSINETYSTEETRIGTWIDGKPLYRRIIIPENITSSGMIATIPNVDTVFSLTGTCYSSSSNTSVVNIPYLNSGTSQSGCIIYYDFNYEAVMVTINGTVTVLTVIFEYTKTTD